MKLLPISLALVALPMSGARPQTPRDTMRLEVVTARFFRSAGVQTVVDAFCQVPFALLSPLSGGGASGSAAYRIAVAVRDSAGLELVARSWTQTVAGRLLGVPRGSAAEHFSFVGQSGRYTVEVTVTDSATGRVGRGRAEIRAFGGPGGPPAASDLLLASRLRAVAGDAAPAAGEIRKGGTVLETSGRPVLTPQQARLGYYLELYPPQADTVSVVARVRTAQGAQVVATPAQPVPVAAGGGVTQATLDLAGLPPGEYRLEVAADSVTRSAAFRMAGFETEQALAGVAAEPDPFAVMAEAQLDTVYLPLVYLMTGDEQGTYTGLTLEGKRRWLRLFWQKRDPTAGTPRNEAQEDFYARIAEANRRYREGGSAQIPGWRTDRGRIFIRYGPPDEVLNRPQSGTTRPYEVWKYTRIRVLKYLFLDQTLFGNYALIWTDDRREPSRANWQELLGPEGVIDVERF